MNKYKHTDTRAIPGFIVVGDPVMIPFHIHPAGTSLFVISASHLVL